MVKVTSQFREKRTGISKAAPIESWERGYLSNACNSPVGGHLYYHSFTSVHFAVSGIKLVNEWQAIRLPLNINDFHIVGVLMANVGTWRNRACASPGKHFSPPDPLRSCSRA